MTCRRSSEIDVSAFLLDDGDEAFDEFRAHFVDCDACADAVARWMAFDHALATSVEAAGDALHPEPAALAAWARSRAAGDGAAEEDAAAAGSVAAHVARCAACSTELALLERFDSSAMQGALASLRAELAEADDAWEEEAWGSAAWPARALAWIGDALRTPIGVGALAAAGALGLYYAQGSPIVGPEPANGGSPARASQALVVADDPPFPDGADGPDGAPIVDASRTKPPRLAAAPTGSAAREATAAPPTPDAPPSSSAVTPPSSGTLPPSLAQAQPEARPARRSEGSSTSTSTSTAPSRPPARVARTAEPPPPAPAPSPAASEPRPREILLAALMDLPGVDYGRPARATDWRAPATVMRSGTSGPEVKALAPSDHVGLTLQRRPRLWWYLPEATEHAVELTIVDEASIDPVLGVLLRGPHVAGRHPYDLSSSNVELVPGTRYRWFVTLVVDPIRPSRNPISFGAFEVVAEADPRRAEIQGAPAAGRGHALARAGIWYDAFDFFATLALEHPDVPVLARHRERLVELVHALE